MIWIPVLAIAILAGCTQNEQKEEKDTTTTNTQKMEETVQVSEEMRELLESLNRAVSNGGDPEHPIEDLVSKGESNAKFTELKRRIEAKGYSIEWDQDKYKLVKAK